MSNGSTIPEHESLDDQTQEGNLLDGTLVCTEALEFEFATDIDKFVARVSIDPSTTQPPI